MFSTKLTCTNCNKQREKTDEAAIIVQAKKLNNRARLRNNAVT